MFVAGEHCDNETMVWACGLLQKPVLDNWWQTGKLGLLVVVVVVVVVGGERGD